MTDTPAVKSAPLDKATRHERFAAARARGCSIEASAGEASVSYGTGWNYDHDPDVRVLIEDLIHERRTRLIATVGAQLQELADQGALDHRVLADLYKSGFRTPVYVKKPEPPAAGPTIDVHLTIRVVVEAIVARLGLPAEAAAAAVAEAERIMAGVLVPGAPAGDQGGPSGP